MVFNPITNSPGITPPVVSTTAYPRLSEVAARIDAKTDRFSPAKKAQYKAEANYAEGGTVFSLFTFHDDLKNLLKITQEEREKVILATKLSDVDPKIVSHVMTNYGSLFTRKDGSVSEEAVLNFIKVGVTKSKSELSERIENLKASNFMQKLIIEDDVEWVNAFLKAILESASLAKGVSTASL